MASIYVRSTDGSNSDDGSTWALATLDLHTATTGGLAKAGVGGTNYISQSHAGSYSVAITYATGGTLASPNKIICGNDAAGPPTSLATTATETTSASGTQFLWTGSFYWYGTSFITTYTGSGTMKLCTDYAATMCQYFDNCYFNLSSCNAGTIYIGYDVPSSNDYGGQCIWKDCNVKLATSTAATISPCHIDFTWVGGAVVTNTTLPSYLFTTVRGCGTKARIEGVDLSVLSGKTLVNLAAQNVCDIKFIDCKLPASITLTTTPVTMGQRVAMYNCDSGVTGAPTRSEVETYAGGIFSERTLIRTGGASDGTTGHSWKFVTNANAEYPSIPLRSDPIHVWNSTTGSSVTLTVELLHDSATDVTDQEVWLEVSYLGNASYPTASFSTIDNPLSGATDLTNSAATWTTTGMSNPNPQSVAFSFTPQLAGYLNVVVCVGKASKTLYVCPKLTLA